MKDVNTITVRVPIAIKRRRGRKCVVAPNGTELAMASPSAAEIDLALVKAIARANCWQRMLESGEYSTLRELSEAERLDAGYISRMLRLTLIPPTLVDAILEGRQPKEVTLNTLMRDRSSVWAATALDGAHDTRDAASDEGNRFMSR